MTKAKETKSYDLTEGPLLSKILKFTLPLMATGLLQTLYNASDMIVVGRFSPNGSFSMGAVGSCGALINLIINVFLGLAVGVGICVARGIGAGRIKEVKDTVHTALVSGTVCGFAVGVFGFLMAKPLLHLMGTPDDILIEAVPYMRAYFVGIPAALVYNFLAAALRSSGDTKRPLVFLASSGILNVVLNLILVIVFGMGAVGVGIATAAAQYASAIMILIYLNRYNGICKLRIKEARIHKERLLEIIKDGVPAGIQSVVFSFSNVLIQSTINSYGSIVVSGSAAASNIEGFIYVAMNSLYQTAMTFTSQHIGAEKIERTKRVIMLTVAVVAVIGILISAVFVLSGEFLLSVYVNEEDPVKEAAVIAAGMEKLMILGTTYVLCGIMDVLCGNVRGMGKSILPTAVSILGSCLLRVLWVYTVCALPFHQGNITVLYFAYPVTWLVTLLGHLVCCVKSYKDIVRRKKYRDSLFAAAKEQRITQGAV